MKDTHKMQECDPLNCRENEGGWPVTRFCQKHEDFLVLRRGCILPCSKKMVSIFFWA